MLAIVAGAASTATLAWFTTSREAKISFTNAGIYSTGGKLDVKYLHVKGGGTVESDSVDYIESIAITGSTDSETDVSGLPTSKFYSVTWGPKKAESSNASLYQSLYTATAFTQVQDGDNAFIHFQLDLRNGATNTVNLVLQNGTDVTPNSDSKPADVLAAKSTRVAILSGNTIKSMFAHSDDTSFSYVSAKDNSYLYGLEGFEAASVTGNYFHNVTTSAFTTIAKSSDKSTYNYLGDLAGGANATYDVYVWSEGTDSSCTNDAKTGQAKVTLKFATVDAA